MKKSDIERQLKKDLSASAPSDFNAVWDRCSADAAEVKQPYAELVPETGRTAHGFNGRRVIPAVSLVLVLLLCCAAVFCTILIDKFSGGLVLPDASGYFTIDVNPSVQVNYNEKGVVTSAAGLNSDGARLLSGLYLVDKTYDVAADEIFERCDEYGYFSASHDGNAILMTASKSGGEKDEKITAELNKKLAQKFADKKLTGIVISDVDNSKWQDEAERYGINGQKYELIMRYVELGGEIDESEFVSVTIGDLYKGITELEKNSKDK